MKKLKIGDKVPAFTVPSTAGDDFKLSDFLDQKIILYFYPKDATPGCTTEGHEFTKLLPQFKKNKTLVLGISRDSIKSHLKFKEKEGYKLDLLSDVEEKLCQIFDVIKEKNMYGKKVMGIERSTFLINEDGRLAVEWRKVKVLGHAQEVLDRVKELQ